MSTIIIALIGVLAGGGVWTFISSLLERKDEKNEDKEELKAFIKSTNDSLKKAEKDSIRTQMLILINHYPTEHKEILTLGEKYFIELKGNWYFNNLFIKWLNEESLSLPTWWDKVKQDKAEEQR